MTKSHIIQFCSALVSLEHNFDILISIRLQHGLLPVQKHLTQQVTLHRARAIIHVHDKTVILLLKTDKTLRGPLSKYLLMHKEDKSPFYILFINKVFQLDGGKHNTLLK